MWSAACTLCVLPTLWASSLCHTLLTVGPCVVNNENVTFDCSRKNLMAVPRCIWPNVTKLDLSENHLNLVNSKAFSDLQHFDHLITLNLSGNYLPLLTKKLFHHLPSLQILDLSSCKLAAVEPGALMKLPKLQKVFLHNNDLKPPISAVLHGHEWSNYEKLSNDPQQSEISKKTRRIKQKVILEMTQEKHYNGHDDIINNNPFQRKLLAETSAMTPEANTTKNTTGDSRKSSSGGWQYLVAVLVTAICASILIAVLAKCKIVHQYLASYRHSRLSEADTASQCDPANFEVEFSSHGPARSVGHSHQPAAGMEEDDDGFIEDNYIQASERERAARESENWEDEEVAQDEEDEDEIQFSIA